MSGMAQEDGSSSISSSPLHLFSLMSLSPGIGSPYPWLREMESEERGLYLIHLLVACANHVAAGSIENANIGLEQINHLASADGDTMQRIAAYFTEALANRMLKGWPGLYKAINSTKITSVSEDILVKRLFFDLCPFLRLSYLITNQAILEAMEGEKMVHIIDLCSSEPAQWMNLLQSLSTRPEGPPHLRITGIHQQKEVLEQMALRLNEEAERLDIPFQFNPVVSRLDNLEIEALRYKSGEALAISSVLQLHTLLAFDDENKKGPPSKQVLMNSKTLGDFLKKDITNAFSPSPDSTSSSPLSMANSAKMMNILNTLWTLSPKLMVVTEQESNLNGFSLMERVLEALIFYAALFDCLESTVPRASLERQKVEKMLFGEEIKNMIACEGFERKVRHEKLEKWVPRLELAGFGRVPLSYNGLLLATRMLQNYGYDGYKMKEENGCFVICWHNQPLYSISAWKSRRYS
ncbi:scarecrow-like protein 3 [Tanacetum coccineum]